MSNWQVVMTYKQELFDPATCEIDAIHRVSTVLGEWAIDGHHAELFQTAGPIYDAIMIAPGRYRVIAIYTMKTVVDANSEAEVERIIDNMDVNLSIEGDEKFDYSLEPEFDCDITPI